MADASGAAAQPLKEGFLVERKDRGRGRVRGRLRFRNEADLGWNDLRSRSRGSAKKIADNECCCLAVARRVDVYCLELSAARVCLRRSPSSFYPQSPSF